MFSAQIPGKPLTLRNVKPTQIVVALNAGQANGGVAVAASLYLILHCLHPCHDMRHAAPATRHSPLPSLPVASRARLTL